MLDKKPARYLEQPTGTPPAGLYHDLYGSIPRNAVFGSESNSYYVDVLSLGPIGGVDEVYLNETSLDVEEFPDSTVFTHDGNGGTSPWSGNFPYVERTYTLNKDAEITEAGSGNFSVTSFTRQVSSLGVVGIRINFTTATFLQKDDKNREKPARARFSVTVLDSDGNPVSGYSKSSNYEYFSAKNPTALQVYIAPPQGYESTHWEYKVVMEVVGYNYGVSVTGNWSASTATEIYKDTQTYNKIAFSSGNIVASDVSGSIPKRQYLARGYKVKVPVYQTILGEEVLTGNYTTATSDSPAWNAMAVLTDELWGGGLSLDKIDIVSFDEFHKYCSELVDGEKRYSFSQYLIQSDNYYKLASEMVGSADGRLYEDTSGRIGVLIDRQTSKRRVITSYDVVGENVKRTTVSDNKKTNYIEAEFEDKDNLYKNTIIFEEDAEAVAKNGVISESLKLDTCTRLSEAERVIKKVLTTSQVTTSSYVFKVGHTHEDIQIGEVVELYDRIHSNVNYCGKVAEGSTLSVINIDPRTPINLTGIKIPVFTLDNSRDVPIKVAIASWTSLSITLSVPLEEIPADFTSFGVDDADDTGVKPTLIRILGVDDSSGVLSLEGVEYNDSLYDHVENGSELIVHKYRYTPDQMTEEITGLSIVQGLGGLTASWAALSGYDYAYSWKVTPLGSATSTTLQSGITSSNSNLLPVPLTEGLYQIKVAPVLNGEQVGEFAVQTTNLSASVGSSLTKPTNLVVIQDDGTESNVYLGNSFTVGWTQADSANGATLSHFKLRIRQGTLSKELVLDKDLRMHTYSKEDLSDYFGSYSRDFTIEILAVDETLLSTALTTLAITNVAPPAPAVSISDLGSITLSYSPSIPYDVIGAQVYLWEGTSTSGSIPVSAKSVTSSSPTNVMIPEGYVKTDGTPYVFDVVWIDGFGNSSNNTRKVFSFNPNEQVPVVPELTTVTPIDSQTVLVNFEHDGTYLAKMKISYRRYGTAAWTELAEVFNIPNTGSNNGFDSLTGTGFIRVSGLVRNFDYEFKVVAANTESVYSEDSNLIIGTPYLDTVTGDELGELTNLVDQFETDFKLRISEEVSNRRETDKALFNTAASAVQLRKDLEGGLSGLTDAIFEVDPASGQIINRAFAYTDDAFSQANLLIDGVSAEVSIQAARVTTAEDRITSAESEIAIQAGKIALKASYTEVNEIIAGAIDSIIPAYSFGFFNSTEGWTAVNGSITQSNNSINLVIGDITNQGLNYSADENPVISLSIERTAGAGWVGDLIVTYSGGTAKTFSGVIGNLSIGNPLVRVLNLSGEANYTGTVTGIRLVLGNSPSDTFNITGISIGKPSAALESLEGLTAQVNQLGVDIDAVEGSLTNYVTSSFYGNNSVTFNNLNTTLEGAEAIISLKATQQQLASNGTVEKASGAAIWIDAAESNITQVVESYNAQPNGINDQLEVMNDQYMVVQTEIDSQLGLIRDQSVSINRLGNADREIEKNGFYAAAQLLKQREGLLEIGEAVATADSQIQSLTDDTSALARELTTLSASFGTEVGQINASFTEVNTAIANETTARSSAIKSLTTSVLDNVASISETQEALVTETTARTAAITQLTAQVGNDIAVVDQSAKAAIGYCTISGNTSSHETKSACISAGGTWTNSTLASSVRTVQVSSGGNTATVGDFFESYIDLEGNVSGKAVLGVDINGAFTGMSVVGGNSFSKLTFKGNAVEFQTAAGVPALYWSSADNTWVFNGRLVVGGYTVNSESDIRALDGDTIYEVYQYSINGATNWHTTYTTGDLYRRTATVTNGVQSGWSTAARITGIDGATGATGPAGANGTNGYNNATVFLYQRATSVPALPSVTTTYTFTTKVLAGVNNGWSQTIPTGTSPLYVTAATASATTATDTIASNEWTTASILATNGSDGAAGSNGADGLNSATVFLYRRSATTPTKPTVSTTYTFSSGVLTGANNGWTQSVPAGTDPVYVITATAVATGATDTIPSSEWSSANVLAQNGSDGVDGSNGASGAGLYGSTYSTISWTTATANSRFLALVGRNPVNLDVFTQTRIDGTDSQARQYNGSSWVTVALYVNGSIFAKNTVAGDVLIAGTEVNAPIINGGTLQMVGSTHMKYTSSTAFGPNSLIDWYGAKISGVNWNATTLKPIPNGMLKSNAITYLDANGEAYFGGSILAGTLRNAARSTQKSGSVSVDTGVYGSNGGIITLKGSVSLSLGIQGSGACPTTPNPVATMKLYEVSGGGVETLVTTHVVTGQYMCETEGNDNYQSYFISGSFTYTDTKQLAEDRRYKLDVTHNAPILGSVGGSQTVSIISEE